MRDFKPWGNLMTTDPTSVESLDEAAKHGPASVRNFLSQKFTAANFKHGYAVEAIEELWTMITGEQGFSGKKD